MMATAKNVSSENVTSDVSVNPVVPEVENKELVGIRGSIHPELYTRLEKAEKALKVKDRGVIIDMALRTFFALSPQERANAFDLADSERRKLEKVVSTNRDFNF